MNIDTQSTLWWHKYQPILLKYLNLRGYDSREMSIFGFNLLGYDAYVFDDGKRKFVPDAEGNWPLKPSERLTEGGAVVTRKSWKNVIDGLYVFSIWLRIEASKRLRRLGLI